MDLKLTLKNCLPCEGIGEALSIEKARTLLKQTPGWHINEEKKILWQEFVLKNFSVAVDTINKIAQIAEEENHHPDIHLTGYRNLRIELTTHALKGLSENDFIVAAKINEVPMVLKK